MLFYDLDKNTAQKLMTLLEQLPEKYKEAIYLAEIEQISYSEIAFRLKLNIFTLKTRVQRGRRKLVELLLSSSNNIIPIETWLSQIDTSYLPTHLRLKAISANCFKN